VARADRAVRSRAHRDLVLAVAVHDDQGDPGRHAVEHGDPAGVDAVRA
jgi:hypothetical protein